MHVDDEFERMRRAVRSEAPMVLADDWVIVHDAACLAWLEIRLHSAGAVLVVHVVQPHTTRPLHDESPWGLRLTRWYEDDVLDVAVDVRVDGEAAAHGSQERPDPHPRTPRQVLLLQAGGETDNARSQAEWWLPLLPARELEVALTWADGSRRGRVTVDTARWRELAAGVRSLDDPPR